MTITTYVLPDFLNQGQALGAIGLDLDEAVSHFRVSAIQLVAGHGGGPENGYNGPDLKILSTAVDATITPVPEPASAATALLGGLALAHGLTRRRRLQKQVA